MANTEANIRNEKGRGHCSPSPKGLSTGLQVIYRETKALPILTVNAPSIPCSNVSCKLQVLTTFVVKQFHFISLLSEPSWSDGTPRLHPAHGAIRKPDVVGIGHLFVVLKGNEQIARKEATGTFDVAKIRRNRQSCYFR